MVIRTLRHPQPKIIHLKKSNFVFQVRQIRQQPIAQQQQFRPVQQQQQFRPAPVQQQQPQFRPVQQQPIVSDVHYHLILDDHDDEMKHETALDVPIKDMRSIVLQESPLWVTDACVFICVKQIT